MRSIEFIIVCACIVVSGFMAGSEIALFSLSRFQLRSLKERSSGAYRKIRKLLGDPAGLLVTLLVINEGLNIAISTLITKNLNAGGVTLPSFNGIPDWAITSVAGTLLTAPIVLVFCEITPKVIAARANQLIAPLSVGPLTWIYTLMMPIRVALVSVMRFLSGAEKRKLTTKLKEEEFLVMIEEGHREGAIQETEMGLIRNVFDLDDTRVSEIATPINQVQTLPADTSVRSALSVLKGRKYSRVPVTRSGHKNQIVGILYRKDLLLARLDPEVTDLTIETLMHKPLVVSETLRLNALFRRLKQSRTHIAVVESADGVILGIVTMTDVLEALFEDILDPEVTA